MTRAPALLLLLLAACGKPATTTQDLEQLDRELTAATAPGNTRDPAVAAALAGPIMVDPGLAQSANAHTIRPPSRPVTGAIPVEGALPVDPVPGMKPAAVAADCPDCAARRGTLTVGALAQRQRNTGVAGCAARIGYSATWAERLPAAIPLYPAARVIEAAGNDTAGCTLRIVSFVTAAVPDKAVAFYQARARAAGFSAEAQAGGATRVVGGTRGDAAFVVYGTPRAGGGTTVDLIVNGG